MNILEAKGLTKIYGDEENSTKALNDVSLSVKEGEFLAIVGTSGSGKSTLLHMLGGLDKQTSGIVTIDGIDISELKDDEMTVFRRKKIGFVFQSFNLIPVLNVYDNIILPVELDGLTVDIEYVEEIIKILGLENKINNSPNELSGGQQQRVAIARALVSKPAIILADEPTGNLDSKTTIDVMDLLKLTSKKFNQTIIMITHNDSIAKMADRVIQIEDGRILNGGY